MNVGCNWIIRSSILIVIFFQIKLWWLFFYCFRLFCYWYCRILFFCCFWIRRSLALFWRVFLNFFFLCWVTLFRAFISRWLNHIVFLSFSNLFRLINIRFLILVWCYIFTLSILSRFFCNCYFFLRIVAIGLTEVCRIIVCRWLRGTSIWSIYGGHLRRLSVLFSRLLNLLLCFFRCNRLVSFGFSYLFLDFWLLNVFDSKKRLGFLANHSLLWTSILNVWWVILKRFPDAFLVIPLLHSFFKLFFPLCFDLLFIS